MVKTLCAHFKVGTRVHKAYALILCHNHDGMYPQQKEGQRVRPQTIYLNPKLNGPTTKIYVF